MFDYDVDNDGLPDQLYGYRADTSGRLMDNRYINLTTVVGNELAGKSRVMRDWTSQRDA